jgi:hypothetical protein
MSASDPQFIYIVLILPALFGFVLIGEGINKLAHEEGSGVVTIVAGLMFIAVVIFAYLFFSTYLGQYV